MYIAGLSFFEDTYFIRVNEDGSWDEVYNPNAATEFKRKIDAKEWVANNTTFCEYGVAIDRKEAIDKFDAWVERGMVRRSFQALTNLSRKYNGEPREEILQWRFDSFFEDIKQEDYKSWPELSEIFDCLSAVDGYGDESLTVSMHVNKDTRFETFKNELDLVLDRITYKTDDGDICIRILDRFLSENGNSAWFYINIDGTYSIEERYGEGIERVSLKKAFNYWKKYRYYE